MHDQTLQFVSNGAVLNVKTSADSCSALWLFFRLQKFDQRRHRAFDVLAHHGFGALASPARIASRMIGAPGGR
jgi:hypothetical protein